VRLTGDWESWLDFFAVAVIITAEQAVEATQNIVCLIDQNNEIIKSLGRAAASALRVHRALIERPVVTSKWLVEKTGITPATVNSSLRHLEKLGIIEQLSSQKRNRLYSYGRYIDILNQGTELPDKY
jgi:Fic family protein